LALRAADRAESVLAHFEVRHPRDDRPRKAIEAGRAWARGELAMTRRASQPSRHMRLRAGPVILPLDSQPGPPARQRPPRMSPDTPVTPTATQPKPSSPPERISYMGG